jgi:hypothetical protein
VSDEARPRYEAQNWKRMLGSKRHWIVFDRNRGGVALNLGGGFSQFASKAAAEKRAAVLNAQPSMEGTP